MENITYIIIGIIIGGGLTWFLARTRLQGSHENLEAQRRLLETMKGDMTNTFNALSAAALKSSSEEFLKLASENLKRIVSDTKGRLGEHQVARDGMIKWRFSAPTGRSTR